ncbi:MAG: cysteine--tRNA ligase [Candidatus Micrarchaeaceae archaeon]
MEGKDSGKLFVFNTLHREKEEFVPRDGKKVNMFVCGQTVYDDAHMGHAKTYINFDIIVRWLRYLGYEVKYVQNITDIDDKIINRAKERGIDPIELARYYEKRFFEDMEALGVKRNVDMYPRSHDYINNIKDQIQLLIDKGYAYRVDDDIYYDVSKFADYTKLSMMKIEDLVKHRIEPREGKKNSYDFALWKAAKEGEPSWRIKLVIGGNEVELNGRPGWHIEDTAMTYAIFGPQYDIHGGASELIFPHHTNEIAQSEAAFGVKPFVKYWLHSGVLNIKSEKMSKSLKNFVRIRDALAKFDAEEIRLFYASTHYRKDMEYDESLLNEAKKKLHYIYSSFSIFYNSKEAEASDADASVAAIVARLSKEFNAAMNDDFNTPLALSALVAAISDLRSIAESNSNIGKNAKGLAVSTILGLAGTLGILEKDTYKQPLPSDVAELIKEREELRKKGDYSSADAIRQKIRDEYGYEIEDTENGPVWYRKKVS